MFHHILTSTESEALKVALFKYFNHEEINYAYYSAAAEKACGSAIWRSINGERVKCTAVYSSEWAAKDYRWKDAEFMGLVSEFLLANNNPFDYLDNFEEDFHNFPEYFLPIEKVSPRLLSVIKP